MWRRFTEEFQEEAVKQVFDRSCSLSGMVETLRLVVEGCPVYGLH
jgi:hypothetical protein